MVSFPFPQSREREMKDCSKDSGEVKFKEERYTPLTPTIGLKNTDAVICLSHIEWNSEDH